MQAMADTAPAAAPVNEIGYQLANPYYWWLWENETTPELVWPQSVYVYDQMRRTDAQVGSVLRAVTLPVVRTPWRIDPNGARDEVVEFVADDMGLPIVGKNPKTPPRTKDKFSWSTHLTEALLMLPIGYSYFEQVYRPDDDGNRAHLRKLALRPAKSIQKINVATDGGLVSVEQYWAPSEGQSSVTIPVDRLVAYIHAKEGGNWLGTSILRNCYKNWLLKDRLLRVQAQTIERNGMGIPLYRGQEGALDLSTGLAMAKAWRAGDAAGTAIPFGADLVLRGVEGTLPDAEPAVRYHDEQIARAVLAHFLNLGTQTGSWALGTTFADFFTLSLQTLAQQIADTATAHVIEDLVDVNWGPGEPAPRLVFDEIGSRQAATAEALKSLVDSGIVRPDEVLEQNSRQQYGLPPADPSTIRTPPAPGGGQPPIPTDGSATPGDVTPPDQQAAIDAAIGPAPVAASGFLTSEVRDFHGRWSTSGGGGGVAKALTHGGDDPFTVGGKPIGREPLRKAAVARGIPLKRGASRDDIAKALLEHHKAHGAPTTKHGPSPARKAHVDAAVARVKAAKTPEEVVAALDDAKLTVDDLHHIAGQMGLRLDANLNDPKVIAESIAGRLHRPSSKQATGSLAVAKLTPAQAARELKSAEDWAQAARDGRVSRPTAARRIRDSAQARADSAAYIGLGDALNTEQQGRFDILMAEAARLRALADEIEARPPSPRKAAAKGPFDAKEVHAKLASAKTREEGQQILSGLTLAQLREVDPTSVRLGKTKPKSVELIVHARVGSRLEHESLTGGATLPSGSDGPALTAEQIRALTPVHAPIVRDTKRNTSRVEARNARVKMLDEAIAKAEGSGDHAWTDEGVQGAGKPLEQLRRIRQQLADGTIGDVAAGDSLQRIAQHRHVAHQKGVADDVSAIINRLTDLHGGQPYEPSARRPRVRAAAADWDDLEGDDDPDDGEDLDDDEPEDLDDDEAADVVVSALDDWVDSQTGRIAAKFNPNELRDPAGRWASTIGGRIEHALEQWGHGDGPDDPFPGLEREPLRRAAVKRGITLKRGASRDDIVAALLGDARAKAGKGEPRRTATFNLTDADGNHTMTATVYHEGDKYAVYEDTTSGGRGALITRQRDLAGLREWAQGRGETELADWARPTHAAQTPDVVDAQIRAAYDALGKHPGDYASLADIRKALGEGTPEQIRQVEVENKIRTAYSAVVSRKSNSHNRWIMLSGLRDELGKSMDRHEVDAALKRLAISREPGSAHVIPESNQKALTAADREAAVHFGGQDKHAISFDDASPRPLPPSRAEVDAAIKRLAVRPDVRVIPVGNLKGLTPEDRAGAIHLGGETKHAISFEPPSPSRAEAPLGLALREHVTSTYGRHVPLTKRTKDGIGQSWQKHAEYRDNFERMANELALVDPADPTAIRSAAEKWRSAAVRERGVSSMRASQTPGTFHHARGTAGLAAADQYENVAEYLDRQAASLEAPSKSASPAVAKVTRAKAPDVATVASQLSAQPTEAAMIAHLSGDPSLTSAQLKKVAAHLNIDVPPNMRAKSALQMHLAERLAGSRGLPSGLPTPIFPAVAKVARAAPAKRAAKAVAPKGPRLSGLPTDRRPESGDFDDLAERVSLGASGMTRDQRLNIFRDLNATELDRLARKFPGEAATEPSLLSGRRNARGLVIPRELSLDERRQWLADKLSQQRFHWR